jgi:hypothetical protein
MKKSIAKEPHHKRMASRVGAAGVALATTFVLAGCHEAQGGGYIGRVVPQTTNPVFNARADFGFNFQCDDGVKGQITYHDASTSASLGALVFPDLRIHGTVENILVDDNPLDMRRGGPSSQAATGHKTQRCGPSPEASSLLWCSTRASRA